MIERGIRLKRANRTIEEIKILKLYQEGTPVPKIAAQYQKHRSTIYYIIARQKKRLERVAQFLL